MAKPNDKQPNDKQPNDTRVFAPPGGNDDLANPPMPNPPMPNPPMPNPPMPNPMPSTVLSSLPSTDDLKKLEKILPGTVDRVISMAERAQREHIEKERWKRFASFFSGIESFVLKIIASILDMFKTLLDAFKTLSKEYIRLFWRALTFVLGFVTLSVSVFKFLVLTSNIHIFFEIVISIVTASAAMLTVLNVYSNAGKRGISGEKKFTVFGTVRAFLARLVLLVRQASKGGKASSAVDKNKSKRS